MERESILSMQLLHELTENIVPVEIYTKYFKVT